LSSNSPFDSPMGGKSFEERMKAEMEREANQGIFEVIYDVFCDVYDMICDVYDMICGVIRVFYDVCDMICDKIYDVIL